MIGAEADDHARLATLNRPRDDQATRLAIHELRVREMGDYEIAAATSLSVEYVRSVLSEPPSQEVE
jgi:hypothetical protein